jgi:hypothetical protein
MQELLFRRSLIFVGISLAAGSWWLSRILHLSLPAVLSSCAVNLYLPNHNIFPAGYLFNINIEVLFYDILIFCSYVAYIVTKRRKDFQEKGGFFPIFYPVLISVFCVYTLFQTAGQLRLWGSCYHFLHGKPSEQKGIEFYGPPFQFAAECRRLLPGAHIGLLLTDMDITIDPGMLTQRILAYFLYPIDIRGIHAGTPDCLILYNKKNAAKNIPPGYVLLKKIDDDKLIAVKENKQ